MAKDQMMFRVCLRDLVLLCIAAVASSPADAQANSAPDPSAAVPSTSKAATPTAAEERYIKLRDLNAEWQRQREELSAERSRKWREAQSEWKRQLNEINKMDIPAAEKTKKRAAISEEKDSVLKEQTRTYVEDLARINQTREQNRALIYAAQGNMLVELATDEAGPRDGAVSKSANSGERFYKQHCYQCHFYAMEEAPTVVSIWDAVNSFTEAEFIARLERGPGPMLDIPAVKSASDRKLGNVYHYVLTWDDEAVANDIKVPDPVSPGSDNLAPGPSSAAVAGTDLSGRVDVPTAPLPSGATEPASRAEVREQQFGNAEISCNLSGDEFEARWIAPYRSKSGWIPPVQNPGDADNAWVMRLRARLEPPTDGKYPETPRPGWCTWLGDSLGSAAGKSREIVIFARTVSPSFGHFEFTENGIEAHHEVSGSSSGDRAKTFAIDVARAVSGIFYSSGSVSRTAGLVHANVRMIDRRWGVDGETAFIVVAR